MHNYHVVLCSHLLDNDRFFVVNAYKLESDDIVEQKHESYFLYNRDLYIIYDYVPELLESAYFYLKSQKLDNYESSINLQKLILVLDCHNKVMWEKSCRFDKIKRPKTQHIQTAVEFWNSEINFIENRFVSSPDFHRYVICFLDFTIEHADAAEYVAKIILCLTEKNKKRIMDLKLVDKSLWYYRRSLVNRYLHMLANVGIPLEPFIGEEKKWVEMLVCSTKHYYTSHMAKIY
ncbi:hypothetical protein BB560_002314 [Smittium megazygosporum]|uniref:Uncharacterized protein n=1 Tax=Smittium megazygosporum TaxID=133381 RepID=A0A2T9ZF41_9FUNG|nr:hypothetical protein BB560_002314 [Smittium megazygosporum]